MMRIFYQEEAGLLTFEWILLLSILVIGVISGLSMVHDSLNVELSDVTEAVVNVNQSYEVSNYSTRFLKEGGVVNGAGGGATNLYMSSSSVNDQRFIDSMEDEVNIAELKNE